MEIDYRRGTKLWTFMSEHISIVIFLVCPVFSRNLDPCTTLTEACPSAEQWSNKGKFNCPGKKSYICLKSTGDEIREGCIFNYTIPAGATGCPCTDRCDPVTDQPALVVPQKYLPCPPENKGCPPRNHPGYSILDIHIYPACQKKQSFHTSSPSKVYDTTTKSRNDSTTNSQDGNDAAFHIEIAVLLSYAVLALILLTVVYCIRRDCYKCTITANEGTYAFIVSVPGSERKDSNIPIQYKEVYRNEFVWRTGRTNSRSDALGHS